LSIVSSISTRPVAEDLSGRAPERRHHHRALVGASAWLVVDEQRYDAECVNVSMGGAAVLTAAAPAMGSHVRFELSLGLDRGSVAIDAEVVRAAEGEVGLRFLELDRASLEALLALV
jgi:c-di-GMP-binding flagellar brake protein YcgR